MLIQSVTALFIVYYLGYLISIDVFISYSESSLEIKAHSFLPHLWHLISTSGQRSPKILPGLVAPVFFHWCRLSQEFGQSDSMPSLSAGEHTMTAVFVDEMTATVRSTIQDKKETPVRTYRIPATGID